MTLEEVADAVGLSVSGVRKRLRALSSLAIELRDAA
jgi:DNA-binding Lrp family transcriptional regulator